MSPVFATTQLEQSRTVLGSAAVGGSIRYAVEIEISKKRNWSLIVSVAVVLNVLGLLVEERRCPFADAEGDAW